MAKSPACMSLPHYLPDYAATRVDETYDMVVNNLKFVNFQWHFLYD